MHAATAPATLAAATAAYPGAVRVAGALTADAHLTTTTGREPAMHLHLALQPAEGLPYRAVVPLGTDVADHMAAEALLPRLRAGATVSVAARALVLRQEHGQPVLHLAGANAVLLLEDPRPEAAPAQASLL